ncbi:nitroreductase [Lewinellaceae bacterium SD302]|nr:nitroreductase [Lewinellaceae bacterium SD302]
MNLNELNQLIRKDRKSVFPQFFTDKPISRETLEILFENANWAPNHARTEPWRWVVYRGEGRQELAKDMERTYRDNVAPEKQDDKKIAKVTDKILNADTIIGIVMHRDEKERIPEWEEVAAVAMAVQNLWLSLDTLGIGGYWASPGYFTRDTKSLSRMGERERCLGLFFLGHHAAPELPRERGDWREKVQWVEN